jgi:4,5-DOPA dioxygenase extradiol
MDTHAPRPPALPPVFLSHGSPMTALEPGAAGAFWSRLGPALVATFGRPKAVLVVSAHTLAKRPVLLGAARHEAVHDFGGFDERLYRMRYDAPGAPALAANVAARLADAGFEAGVSDAGGLDHGIWVPLRFVFPAVDLPVLPLAWPAHAPPSELVALGRALAPLAAEGVWIVGTGSITHNLRRVFAGGRMDTGAPATPESAAFRDWIADRAAAGDEAAIAAYRTRAPHAALMHPTDEHLLPLHVALGAGGGPGLRLHASHTHADLGMDAYAFGPGAAALSARLQGEAVAA